MEKMEIALKEKEIKALNRIADALEFFVKRQKYLDHKYSEKLKNDPNKALKATKTEETED